MDMHPVRVVRGNIMCQVVKDTSPNTIYQYIMTLNKGGFDYGLYAGNVFAGFTDFEKDCVGSG